MDKTILFHFHLILEDFKLQKNLEISYLMKHIVINLDSESLLLFKTKNTFQMSND